MATWAETRAKLKKEEEENKRTWADVKSERENGTGVFGDYESVTTANAMAEYRYTQALKSLEEERKKESKINKAVKRTGISSLSDSKRMGAQRYSIALDDDIKTQGNRQSAINDYYNTGKQSSYLKNMLKSTGGTKDTPADTRMVALEKREKGKIDVLQSQKRDLQKYNKQSLPSGFKTDDLREQLKEVENKIAIIENSESEDVPVAGYQGILDSYGGKDTPNATKAEVALKDLYNQKYELDNALSVYDQRMKAQEIFTTADYAEKSKANPNEKNDLYRVINNIDGQQVWRRGNADLQKYVGTLSQDEIGVFNYIFATEGEEAAQAYLNSIDVDTRKAAQTQENVKEFAENAPVASWFLNRVTKPFVSGAYAIQQGVSSAGNYIGSVAGRTQDEYGGYVTPQTELSTPVGLAQLSAETIDTVGAEKAEDAGGPLGSLLYQAGTSGIDSAVAGLLSGGNPAAISAIMSGESTASTILQNKMEGKSDSEALLKGVIAGSIEALTERFSVEMIMKDPTNTLGSYLKAFVAEGSEEVTNNWLNRFADSITDSWVGRENEFNAEVENKMASGQNVFEAMANTFGENLPDYLVEDLESFVVGGTSGLGLNVVGNITSGSFSQIGKSVRAAGSEQFYLDQARAMPETTEAHQLAVKWREGEVQTNDYVLGQIASGVVEYAQNTEGSHYEAIRAEDNTKTIQDVFKNSEAGKNVNKQALDEIVSEYDPDDGVSAEVYANGALSAYTYGSKGLNIEKFMENDPLSGELKEWQINNAFRLGQVFADAKTDAKAVSDVIRYDVSETGETRVKETAAPVNVQGVESIENGEVILALENGEKVSASALEFGTKEEAVLYEAVSEFDADAKTANALVQTYKSSDDVFEYADTMQKAYLYGEYNLPIEDLEGEKGASQAQIESIYKLGREYMSKITAPKTVSQTGTGNQAKKGTVVYSGNLNSLNNRQRVSISALEKIASATGIDFALFESPVKEGRRTGVNGYYDRSTNKIYIDVYSGVQGNDTILFTAAHELTHFVKEWSPDKFGELAGFLIEQYQKENVSVISLVQRQREKAKRNGREISYDEAFEEFVADSMETMLADGKIVEKLSALEAKDKTLFEKLRDKIRELVKQIQNVYKGLKADSAEGRYVAEMQDALQRIQDLFTEGVTEASTNYKSTLPVPNNKNNADSKGNIRYSSRYAEVTIDDYTEKTYNESGWVFINKLLTSDETKKFSDQFANRLSRKYKDYFPKTKDGYFVFTVGDDNKPQNKFIFAKGTLKNPIIKSVIETDFDEFCLDEIRDYVITKRGGLFESDYWNYIEDFAIEENPIRYRVSDFQDYQTAKQNARRAKTSLLKNNGNRRTMQKPEGSNSSFGETLSSEAENGLESKRRFPGVNKNSERDPEQQKIIKQLERRNQKLEEDVKYLRELVKLQKEETHGLKFTRNSIETAAHDLKRKSGSKGDLNELVSKLNEFYEYVASGDELTQESIFNKAEVIADWLYETTPVKFSPDDYSQDILQDLKNRRVSLDETQKKEVSSRFESYNNFRGQLIGNITIAKDGTPIESVWQELAELYPDVFDVDENSASMGTVLYDTVQMLKSTDLQEQEYRENKPFVIQDLIFDVYESYWGLSTLKTVADKYEPQVGKLTAERNTYKTELGELQEKHAEVTKDLKEIIRAFNATAKEAKLLMNSELRKQKKEANTKFKNYKKKVREKQKERIETAERNKYKKRIQRDVDDLTDWILNPSNKTTVNRVPDAIKRPVIEFIDSIDYSSQKALEKEGFPKKDREMLKKIMNLRHVLAENQKLDELYSSYTDLPPDFLDMLDNAIQPIQELIAESDGQDFVLNRMESKDLKNLSEIVSKLKKYVKEFNQFHANAMYKHVYEAGDNSVDTMAKMGSATAKRAVVKGANNFVYWKNMRPAYAFERFGKGGVAIYDGLRRGQDKLAFNTKQVTDFSEKTFTPKEVKEWGKEIKEFSLSDGSKIKMPVTHIMGLYELMKRQQGLQHLLGGGLRVAAFKDSGKQISDVGHLINQDDLNNIVGSLSKRQIEVADALQNYMGTVGSAWGNEVTVKRFGERLFGEKNYYPINSDGRHIPAEADKPADNASLYALLNMGFTKKLEENAKNRVIIYNIFDVFANHMASMAEYNAMALPVLDAIKWFNYKQTKIVDGKTQVIDSVRDEMTRVYGAPAEKSVGSGTKGYAENFVINILKSFNGTENRADPNEGFISKILARYNRSSVAANLRVVVQQPLAIARAGFVISYRSIAPFLRPAPIQVSKAIKEMKQHSGIALWKSLGFYDVNISRGLTTLIKQDDTALDKTLEKSMKLAEKGDEITWARIWLACKREVEKRYNIAPSRPEYFEKVTELFENVIYKTQVVDSTLTKTEFSRSKSLAVRAVSAFMSEAVTTLSMVTDAVFKYRTDIHNGIGIKQAAIKNKKNIGKAAAVYSVSQILNAVVQAAYDAAFRDDEEYADWLEKFRKNFYENLVNEMLPFNKLPIVSDAFDLLKVVIGNWLGLDVYNYGLPSIAGDALDYLIKGNEIIMNKINGKDDNYTWYGGIYKLLQAASGLSGIPGASFTRELVSVWNLTVANIYPDLKLRTYDPGDEADIKYAYLDGYLTFDEAVNLLLEKEIESNKDDAYFTVTKWEGGEGYTKFGSLYEAVRSNGDVKAAMQEYLDHGYTEKELKSNIKSEIGNWYKDKTIGEGETKEYLKKYTDIEAEDIEPTLKKWQCKRDTGFSYEQLKSAYLDGEISRSQAQQYLQKYGGKTSSEASNQISGWEEDK